VSFFDYCRLHEDVDPALRTFLLSLFDTDTLRRAKVAFPEFFSDATPKPRQVTRPDLAIRKRALLEAEEHTGLTGGEELLNEVVSWFGIGKVHVHEQRSDKISSAPYNLLPADFELIHEEDYDGLTNDNPWLVNLSVNGGPETEHLVLEVQLTGDEDVPFFIFTVEAKNICF